MRRLAARTRYRIELAVATVAAVLCALTLVWRDWIEEVFGWDPDKHNGSVEVFGWDPDKHNGSVEWLIVLVLLAVALAVGHRARALRRRLALE